MPILQFFITITQPLKLWFNASIVILFLWLTRIFLHQVLSPAERTRLVENIAGHLKNAQDFIQKRAVANFAKADEEYGSRLAAALKKHCQTAVSIVMKIITLILQKYMLSHMNKRYLNVSCFCSVGLISCCYCNSINSLHIF